MSDTIYFAGLTLPELIATIVMILTYVSGLWAFFLKAGKPGWWSLLPWINILLIAYTLRMRLGWVWLLEILLAPIAFPISVYYWHLCLARACGYKGVGVAIAMLLFPYFTVLFVGFSQRKYDYERMVRYKENAKLFWLKVMMYFFYTQLAKSETGSRYWFLAHGMGGRKSRGRVRH